MRRLDAFDARTAFRFEVLAAGSAGSAAISPTPATAYLLLGAGLLVLGLLFLLAGLPLGGWFSRSGAGVMTPGVAGVAAGLLLLFNAQLGLGGGEVLRSPYPPTPESLEAGVATYGQVCQTCHGAEGRGDCPAAVGFCRRRPAWWFTYHCAGRLTSFASSATASPTPPWPRKETPLARSRSGTW